MGYNRFMVVVLGPCFSTSASGLLGKALLYYDTKYGARIRTPKRTFTPPSQSWIVNQEWFKKANARSRIITGWQKFAWLLAYPGICDTWRDIFMGKQIEMWNISPLNDVTWPPLTPGDSGWVKAIPGQQYENIISIRIETEDVIKRKRWAFAWVFFLVLDNARQPREADMIKASRYSPYLDVEFIPGHVNYIWGGIWLVDGSFKVGLAGSYDKT